MNTTTTLFSILGSSDSEMTSIEALLAARGIGYAYATNATGGRVFPGQPMVGTSCPAPAGAKLVGVELIKPTVHLDVVIDHHDSHPNAALPPERFWEASSLGQVVALLQGAGYTVDVTPEMLAEAAADHCIAAAFQGKCPGVDLAQGSAQYNYIVYSRRGTFAPNLTDEQFEATLQKSIATLKAAPSHPGFTVDVADLRGLPLSATPAAGTGEFYPVDFQFGPLVASIAGRAYITEIRRRDGAMALRLGGAGIGTEAGPAPIEEFMADPVKFGAIIASEPHNVYGVPARGFAGGTISLPA